MKHIQINNEDQTNNEKNTQENKASFLAKLFQVFNATMQEK